VATIQPQLTENKQLQELAWALAPDAYWRQKAWKKVAVIAAGPLTNLAFCVVLLAIVYMIGIPIDASRRVEVVSAGTPAAAAGLRPGDLIVAVGGQPVRSPGSLDRALALAAQAGQATVRVRRGARHRELPVTLAGAAAP
jgi:regulator of sigma E protease